MGTGKKKIRERAQQEKRMLREHFKQLGQQMNDATGKKIELGQIVEIQLLGMMRGQIIQVNESVIALPGRPPMPPHVIVNFQAPVFLNGPTPNLPRIYIVDEAPKVTDREESIGENPASVIITDPDAPRPD
jgi:hypothetical protein